MADQFVRGQRYSIVTVGDGFYTGIVDDSTETAVSLLLTEDSDYFFADDLVTLNLNQIIAVSRVLQND